MEEIDDLKKSNIEAKEKILQIGMMYLKLKKIIESGKDCGIQNSSSTDSIN